MNCIDCNGDNTEKWYSGPLCRKCYSRRRNTLPGVKQKNAERAKAYRANPKRVEYLKKYKQTEEFKSRNRERAREFRKSVEGKEYRNNIVNKNPNVRFSLLKSRAKKRGACNISKDQYFQLISRDCYYCNKSLKDETGVGLDRIDNKLGYLIDNVLPCCSFCNLLRSNLLDTEETKVVIAALKNYWKGLEEKTDKKGLTEK